MNQASKEYFNTPVNEHFDDVPVEEEFDYDQDIPF